jgi:hypothetical protein
MLHLWLRAVLGCLLAAALPIQGVAAATMLHCGQGGPGDAPAHEGAHARPAGMQTTWPSHLGHHHGIEPAGVLQGAGTPIAAAKSGCSACASCCIATALPAAIHAFDATAPAESFAPSHGLVAPVFLTGGPERPPRPLHA